MKLELNLLLIPEFVLNHKALMPLELPGLNWIMTILI
jgi:hypothetical protein